ncbi:response regulator transcription factor [Macrococcus hajekii]|uniref:Response regulator ArlR n=1 Tax=Macrococcus hajekii TaxID=198482 RepID=A0A4R6BMP9_9STAP|nr:response regulator transcription factor [Macrococcus hajekii]TDM03041.1 response regulator transcription factor [Macrococcus hajekii]GGB06094.1 response regulator ArlR [Macrococcus hajekii]
MRKILIIEDEHNLARFIELELMHENYEVQIANDGEAGLHQALHEDYGCILLDLMLPRMNGLEVCRQLRKVKDTPIIMITAKGDTQDKVTGLDYGADDYIVKPFDIEELLARLRVIMRRQELSETLRIGELSIDEDAFKVYVGATNLELTKTEFELLKLLAEHRNHVMTREQILTHVWGYDSEVETNVVDVYIRYIRNKLKPFNLHSMIETVRGVGYVIR